MSKIFLKFLNKKSKGFTLLEILVSLFIVVSLTVLVFANFELGGYSFKLKRSLRGLSQQIRSVQEMAFSSKTIKDHVPQRGYGIHFDNISVDKYILFANESTTVNYIYDPGLDTIIGEYYLEDDVIISGLYSFPAANPVAALDIVFVPPNPDVYINGFLSGGGPDFYGKIDLTAINRATGSVSVNGVGLIEIKE
jgi:prepilin-type N-terminal cleavage/methylation domain-containing protein